MTRLTNFSKILFLSACLALLSFNALSVSAAEVVSADLDGPLSLERCIELALLHHPSLAEARGSIEAQSARVGQAAAGGRPQVSVSPSYSYSGVDGGDRNGRYNTDFTLRQELYDWGRRDLSIEGARREFDARLMDRENTVEAVISDVAGAYYSLNRSDRALSIAEERMENYARRLQWAQDFYRIGVKAKIEVTKAQTDLANAKLELVNAQGARGKAVSTLASSMGIPSVTPSGASDRLLFARYSIKIEDAVAQAMANRPDLHAQDVRVEGARSNLALAKKGLAPSVSGSAGYSFYGETDPLQDRSWRVSAGMEIPVFDGGLTREQIRQAEADLLSAEARRETLRQNIVLQARTAYESLMEAEEAVSAAYEAERMAKETLALAQGRYKAGVGESLEISDAVEGYAKARISVTTALYNHKAAELELKRVMGVVADGFESPSE